MEANQSTDFFLKIDGIDGESTDSKIPDAIRIEDFSASVVNRGRRGDYGVGKPIHEDMVFHAFIDKSYTKLKQACANHDAIPKAILTCRKAGKGQQDFLKITLSDLLITSCKLKTDNSSFPLMEFTISFVKKQIEYKEQKQDGTLSGAITAVVDLHGKRSGTA